MPRRPPTSPPFPYTTLFRSVAVVAPHAHQQLVQPVRVDLPPHRGRRRGRHDGRQLERLARRVGADPLRAVVVDAEDRKSTRLNSSHSSTSYAVFCLKQKTAT